LFIFIQTLEAAIDEYEPIFNKIFDIGEKAVKETSGAEAKEFEDELTDVKTVWYQLNTLLQDRRNKIASVEPLAEKYQKALQSLAVTMTKTDQALDDLEVIGAEPEKVQEQLDTLRVCLLRNQMKL
jgi:soluble cytochrome b562